MLDLGGFSGRIAKLAGHSIRECIRRMTMLKLPGSNRRIFKIECPLYPAIYLPDTFLDRPCVNGFEVISEIRKFRFQRQVKVIGFGGECAGRKQDVRQRQS